MPFHEPRTSLRPRSGADSRRPAVARAFTLAELQVAIIVVSIGMIAVSSVLAAESRMLRRLHGKSRPAPATPPPTLLSQSS